MNETPIKIPKWLSARVYNLNLVPDAVSYDEMRHYSAEDIVWLLNQISDEDEIREYATVDCGDGVTIELPSRIRFKANMPNFEWTSCRLDYYDKVEHRYLESFGGFYIDTNDDDPLGFHPNGIQYLYHGGYC